MLPETYPRMSKPGSLNRKQLRKELWDIRKKKKHNEQKYGLIIQQTFLLEFSKLHLTTETKVIILTWF